MITCAKGLTNGAVPMGAVFARKDIYDAFMDNGAGERDRAVPRLHLFRPSARLRGRPWRRSTSTRRKACSRRCASLAKYWEDAVHSLKGMRNVIDLRNLGLIAGIELEPIPGKPTASAPSTPSSSAMTTGLLIRTTGDIIALSPPLIVEQEPYRPDLRQARQRAEDRRVIRHRAAALAPRPGSIAGSISGPPLALLARGPLSNHSTPPRRRSGGPFRETRRPSRGKSC